MVHRGDRAILGRRGARSCAGTSARVPLTRSDARRDLLWRDGAELPVVDIAAGSLFPIKKLARAVVGDKSGGARGGRGRLGRVRDGGGSWGRHLRHGGVPLPALGKSSPAQGPTLSTRELALVTARLQQLARLSELGGGPGGQTPNDWSRQLDHWHGSDLECLRARVRPRAARGSRPPRVDGTTCTRAAGTPDSAGNNVAHNFARASASAAPLGALAAEPRALRVARAARASRLRSRRRDAPADMGR